MMSSPDVQFFFQALTDHIPLPQTELNFCNTYTLLVAVVLSAQATDKGVNKATQHLFECVKTPEDMLSLGEEGLKTFIKTIGLYHSKARYIMELSRMLIHCYKGQVPNTLEDLCALPGVGRKTANVVLNVAFQKPTIPVDTHVFRVSNRTGLAPGETPLKVEQALLRRVPSDFLKTAHHLLILHGRYTCKARNPLCSKCVVRGVCAYVSHTIKSV